MPASNRPVPWWLLLCIAWFAGVFPALAANFEGETNRRGSDYANFDLPAANPQLCFDRCRGDPNCRAWTYVKPGVQGDAPRCWLKNPAPPASPDSCCVSGLVARDQAQPHEVNVNRQGADYAAFDMPNAVPDICQAQCAADGRCAAWTFVRPGVQGPNARCYLKNPAPPATPNNCCVSGLMAGAVAQPLPPPPPPPPPSTGAANAHWHSHGGVHFAAPDGSRFSYQCPPWNPDHRAVWGFDVYTHDSGICTAGLQAGVISRDRGGLVTIEMRPGQSSYGAGERNGVRSMPYGAYGKSFIVVAGGGQQITPAGAGVTAASPPRYLGCFKDPNNPFDLDGHLERSAANSPQRCIQSCAARGFQFAGMQYAESCLCGNSYGRFGAAGNCNMACTGDRSQACGGANANSVYSTGR